MVEFKPVPGQKYEQTDEPVVKPPNAEPRLCADLLGSLWTPVSIVLGVMAERQIQCAPSMQVFSHLRDISRHHWWLDAGSPTSTVDQHQTNSGWTTLHGLRSRNTEGWVWQAAGSRSPGMKLNQYHGVLLISIYIAYGVWSPIRIPEIEKRCRGIFPACSRRISK